MTKSSMPRRRKGKLHHGGDVWEEQEREKERRAVAWGIPVGYSLKQWDPEMRPVFVLGSVFDGDSLGKWIFDWTVFRHGGGTPLADVAGELWLLLLALTVKMKRAEESLLDIRCGKKRDVLEATIALGEDLWRRLQSVVKDCEGFMWEAGMKRRGGEVLMGCEAGEAFVDSIFGRDRSLEETEKLMNGIRGWKMSFDGM